MFIKQWRMYTCTVMASEGWGKKVGGILSQENACMLIVTSSYHD